MERMEKMTRQQRELYKNLLKELNGENNNQAKLILVGGYRSFVRKYVIQTLKCELDALSKELDSKDDCVNYWKDKYDQCLEKLNKKTDKWWKF